MSKLDDLLAAEAAAAEAFEEDQSTPYPDHVTISQPNRARSKVLQVRLNPAALDRGPRPTPRDDPRGTGRAGRPRHPARRDG